MNIFVTDPCPRQCAKYLDDKRVIKLISESVQMLVTALRANGVDQSELPCKPSHQQHPVNIWVRSSRSNYNWLLEHTKALLAEKLKRYPDNKQHVYATAIPVLEKYAAVLGDIGLTKFANCAANKMLGIDYKHVSDVHTAYQMYLSDRWEHDAKPATWYRQSR